MNKIKLILAGSLFSGASLFGAAGIFDSFTIIESTFYDLNASTANADFEGVNLGTFNTTDSISIGGQLKSFKNTGTDVTGALLSYRIFEAGSPSGSFSDVSYAFQFDNVGGTTGDQQWGTQVLGANDPGTDQSVSAPLTALTAGDYKLEVFASITTNGVDAPETIFDNVGGRNYTADFTVVPEPSAYGLILGALGMAFVASRRRRA